MSATQKSILIFLALIAACIFLVLFKYIGDILLPQPQEKAADNNPTAISQPVRLSQPSATPQPFVKPTILPTPTNTRVVSPTPTEVTPASTPLAPVLNITPLFGKGTEPVTQGPAIAIINVNAKDEYVDIGNVGTQAQDITGWILRSEKGQQDCVLSGIIEPGQTLRIWAKQADIGRGGLNCGYGENIWNNYESDPAVLFDTQMLEIDRQ